jgi:hypothetical protein
MISNAVVPLPSQLEQSEMRTQVLRTLELNNFVSHLQLNLPREGIPPRFAWLSVNIELNLHSVRTCLTDKRISRHGRGEWSGAYAS